MSLHHGSSPVRRSKKHRCATWRRNEAVLCCYEFILVQYLFYFACWSCIVSELILMQILHNNRNLTQLHRHYCFNTFVWFLSPKARQVVQSHMMQETNVFWQAERPLLTNS